MSTHPLISIIVPIYNVEKYLPRCVKSLVNQTYRYLEIILVDDGSPDKCGDMCDEYAQKDSRIRVIHKSNGGLSAARNIGIDMSKGNYLMFVDSDDWIEDNTCEVVMGLAEKYKADIVTFGLKHIYEDGKTIISKTLSPRCISPSEGIREMILLRDVINNFACNKIFKKDVFHDIRFPVGRLFEDQGTTYKLFHNAKRIYVSDSALYCYFQRGNSISAGWYRPEAINERFKHWQERLIFLENYYPENIDAQKAQLLLEAYIGMILLPKSNKINIVNLRSELKEFINSNKSELGRLKTYYRKLALRYYCKPLFYLFVILKIKH